MLESSCSPPFQWEVKGDARWDGHYFFSSPWTESSMTLNNFFNCSRLSELSHTHTHTPLSDSLSTAILYLPCSLEMEKNECILSCFQLNTGKNFSNWLGAVNRSVSHISEAKSPSSMGDKSISPPSFLSPFSSSCPTSCSLSHSFSSAHTSTLFLQLVDTGAGIEQWLWSKWEFDFSGGVSPCNHGVESPSETSSPNAHWWSACAFAGSVHFKHLLI